MFDSPGLDRYSWHSWQVHLSGLAIVGFLRVSKLISGQASVYIREHQVKDQKTLEVSNCSSTCH